MKLGEIRERYMGLLTQVKNVYPAVITNAIIDNLATLEKENELLEKKRIQICENYARKDADGNPVKLDNRYDIPDECMDDLNAEIRDLMEIDKEIYIKKFSVSEFDKCEASERYSIPSVSDRIAMRFMVE